MRIQILYVVVVIAIVCGAIFVPVHIANAETVLGTTNESSYIYEDQVWTKDESPYHINGNVWIYGDLTIEAGVEVVGATTTSGQLPNLYMMSGSTLRIDGSKNEHVKINNLMQFSILGPESEAYISYTDFSGIQSIALNVYKAKAVVSNSTFVRNGTAINITNSDVDVTTSRIEGNQRGVKQEKVVGTKLFPTSTPSVHNSLIIDQVAQAVVNSSPIDTIDVQHNWWGTDAGPQYGTYNSDHNFIDGNQLIEYDPWLTEEPVFGGLPEDEIDTKCCSNVLFIPGLKASRLYRDESGQYGTGTTTNRLWDPTSNGDVRALYLDENGESVDANIYSGSPIDSVFGFDIYDSFMGYLDSLKSTGTIKEWKSFGYDWRKPIAEVVAGQEKKSSSTESLIETVEELAQDSVTGRVTIVAHSNGGLVMKYLVKTLAEMGKSDLIDKVISVAVPYLGTPKAILGVLHGYDESIAKGIIVKENVARGLGINMPSAYSLMPSLEYFKQVIMPSIAFANTSIAEVNPGVYSQEIDSHNEQMAFVTDIQDSRSEPESDDVSRPIIGNKILVAMANYIHSILDPFVWPAKIASYAIVGWGNETASGLYYDEKTKCKGLLINRVCKSVPDYSAINTLSGDGTVVTPSAEYNSDVVIETHLGEGSTAEDLRGISHADILSANTTQRVIGEIIAKQDTSFSKSSLADESFSGDNFTDDIAKIPGISIGSHEFGSLDNRGETLVLSTHSPVQLHVYDEHGNHTGEMPPPIGAELGLYVAYENNIPGSNYKRTGDDNAPDTYVSVPDNGEVYIVQIEGTDTGEFTYQVERKRGQETIDEVVYAGLPTTPLMTASTTVTSIASVGDSTTTSLASSSAILQIDINGDMKVDASVSPNKEPDPKLFLTLIRTTLEKFSVKDSRIKELLKKLTRIEGMVKRGKLEVAERKSNKILKQVGHKKLKRLSEVEKKEVIDSIYNYLAQFK